MRLLYAPALSDSDERIEALLACRKGRRNEARGAEVGAARPKPASIGSRGGMVWWMSLFSLAVDTDEEVVPKIFELLAGGNYVSTYCACSRYGTSIYPQLQYVDGKRETTSHFDINPISQLHREFRAKHT